MVKRNKTYICVYIYIFVLNIYLFEAGSLLAIPQCRLKHQLRTGHLLGSLVALLDELLAVPENTELIA